MSKLELVVCQGLPASGKTTFAKKWVEEDPKSRIRVNRDDIRRMLGPYWIPTREDLVTEIEDDMIIKSLGMDYSVIIDATNFKIDRFIKLAINNRAEMKIESFLHVSLEECIKRDELRTFDKVGRDVITRMYNKYIKK